MTLLPFCAVCECRSVASPYRGIMIAPMVILSPSDRAIPCVLLRMRTCPVMVPDSRRSMLRFASASSPERNISASPEMREENKRVPNRLRAYMLADKKSESPAMAPSGVRQDMFVDFMMCFKYSRGSLARIYKQEV